MESQREGAQTLQVDVIIQRLRHISRRDGAKTLGYLCVFDGSGLFRGRFSYFPKYKFGVLALRFSQAVQLVAAE